ncbi:hypothetical protein IJG21_00235 [Candidatus Saccharibacteria bacterium]|nr:hypothetical protein [Candidatus Saccharibacteria bacterium]
MAQEISISKRLKISKAQQNMLGAVLAASMILGICMVLAIYFIKYIKFNATIIGEKDKAIEGYSNMIRDVGVCERPTGKIYSERDLKTCHPNETDVNKVSGSLRSQILIDMAKNEDLESVGRDTAGVCYNKTTGEKYTYEFWNDKLANAPDEDLREYYTKLFGMCSALRAVPDALPANKNELALMASLDKIFEISSWTPTSLSPGGEVETNIPGLGAIEVNLTVEADGNTTQNVLSNIEKSIRDFEINTATIEWTGGQLNLSAKATAFYTQEVGLEEYTETVKGDGTITKNGGAEEGK